jgi:dephospho-CoA kinase
VHVLAVTGGIGSGKTTAARVFGSLGAVVIDLDDLAKRLIAADGPLVNDVAREFDQGVLGADGGVDHAALAAAAFATPEDARRLDAVVHPAVYAAVAGALDALSLTEAPPEVVVIDIPLLAESPSFFDLVDSVLTISATEDARMERLLARGMSEDEVHRRMATQASDAERRDIADHVIDNDATAERFRVALLEFWETEMAPRAT